MLRKSTTQRLVGLLILCLISATGLPAHTTTPPIEKDPIMVLIQETNRILQDIRHAYYSESGCLNDQLLNLNTRVMFAKVDTGATEYIQLLEEKIRIQEQIQQLDSEYSLSILKNRYEKGMDLIKLLYEKVLSLDHHFTSMQSVHLISSLSNPNNFPDFQKNKDLLESRLKKKSGVTMPTVLQNNIYLSATFSLVSALARVYQYDLWANDISSTQTTVGWYDGFKDPIGITFGYGTLGPDCKIYILGQGDTKYFHVIHNPDEQGLACNLEMRGLVLPTPKGASMPFHPNYRLGPIDNPGVPCTPIVSVNTPSPLPALSVFPNPASEQVTIKINHILPDDTVWRLYDALGRLVRVVPISHTGAAQAEVWVANLPSGLYFYEARSGGGLVLRSGSLVVE